MNKNKSYPKKAHGLLLYPLMNFSSHINSGDL